MRLWELLNKSLKPSYWLMTGNQDGNDAFARPLKRGWILEIIPVSDSVVSMYAYENADALTEKKFIDSAEDYEITHLHQLQRNGLVRPYRGKVNEEGKIIPNINTTCDVQPGETQRQAAKFGNTLDSNGLPPLIHRSSRKGGTGATSTMNKGDPWYGEDGTRLKK